MEFRYVIVGAIVVSFTLVHINQRLASPVVAIADRWLRWIIFPIVWAWLCRDFELIDRPMWVLAVAGFLIWFLVETLYNWLRIAALSVSPFPLFPRYVINSSGEEWPVQPRFLKIREWLRAQGFRQVQALKAEVGGDIYMRVSVYQDEAALLRIEVTFLPQNNGAIDVCFSLTSTALDGSRAWTEHPGCVPFGGFYPEDLVPSTSHARAAAPFPDSLALHRRIDIL